MSVLKVNKISNANDDGPVEFTQGLTVSSTGITGDIEINSSGIVTSTSLDVGSINLSGVATAGSFVGKGTDLTNVPGILLAKAVAYSIVT